MFGFGIEHEAAFLKQDGSFVDFTTPSEELQRVIDELPEYVTDKTYFRIGDAGIRVKRWYMEGFERFSMSGELTAYIPKGIEIRTTIHSTIQGAVDELTDSFRLLREMAIHFDLTPVLTSYHPYQTAFAPDPPLNTYEQQLLKQSPEDETALISMLTYGPDLNISLHGLSVQALIDIGRKLTYYSPYIIPFSYSSPFYNGTLWDGWSVRTFLRTGLRPAVQVFLEQPGDLLTSVPSLTKLARIPAEVGRIEFKACDSCANFALYAGLLALLKGLALDETLPGRATVPDAALHQFSARQGFAHEEIVAGTQEILQAAAYALRHSDPDLQLLQPLQELLDKRTLPAHALVKTFLETKSIEGTLLTTCTS